MSQDYRLLTRHHVIRIVIRIINIKLFDYLYKQLNLNVYRYMNNFLF